MYFPNGNSEKIICDLESVRDTGRLPEGTPNAHGDWYLTFGMAEYHYVKGSDPKRPHSHIRAFKLTPRGQDFLRYCRQEPIERHVQVRVDSIGFKVVDSHA